MTRHILPYRVPQDASLCAVRRFIFPVTSVVQRLQEIIFCDGNSLRIETDCVPDDIQFAQKMSLVRAISAATSSAKSAPMMSSTYMSVLLRRAWRSSHAVHLREKIPLFSEQHLHYKMEIFEKLLKYELTNIIDLSTDLYENGFHTKQLIDYFDSSGKNTEEKKALLNLYYYKLKKDFRCEKMLLFYILKYICF